MTPTSIAGYLALFTTVGAVFLFVNLLVGRFVRPKDAHAEKLEIYECGEPTIGSSFVQFDLRFYVVALLFIIFDVEVAFFFPWATVFGKATHVADAGLTAASPANPDELNPAFGRIHAQLGVPAEAITPEKPASPQVQAAELRKTADSLTWISMLDIGVFFAVLMTGFAYVWRRGDLDWVRALSHERSQAGPRIAVEGPQLEPALSA